MRKLPNCGRLEVRESPVEGFGVFATDDILAGTVLEEVPFVLFPRYVNLAKGLYDFLKSNGWVADKETFMENTRMNFKFKEPERYYFKWHPPVQLDGDSMFTVLPLGNGPCYNTSNTANNADWKMLQDTFLFRAEKDIKKDEEIMTFYGYFLGDDGTIFDCSNVFHFAIDMFTIEEKRVHKLKMLRFGSYDTFQTQRSNPAAHKIHTLIQKSVDGLTIKKLSAAQASTEIIGAFDVPDTLPLTQLYQKLVDLKTHPAPLAVFKLEYLDKETQKLVTEEIFWKK
jgi:hypothetical protein